MENQPCLSREKESAVHDSPDSTSTPIIYLDFTQYYIDKLLEKAGGMKAEQLRKNRNRGLSYLCFLINNQSGIPVNLH